MTFREWFKRVTPHEKRAKWAASALYFVIRLLHLTWQVRSENFEKVEEAIQQCNGVLLVSWHGRVIVPFIQFANRGYYALVSRSNDGDMLSLMLEKFGWGLVRGSSGRRAVAALKTARTVLAKPGTILAFTPDGPRGPSGVAKPGMIYLAQKTGKPVFPAGISARPRILFKSWDRYQVPLPFAKCVLIYGDPVYITPDEDLEAATLRVQNAITLLEAEADRRLGYEPLPESYRPLTAPEPAQNP